MGSLVIQNDGYTIPNNENTFPLSKTLKNACCIVTFIGSTVLLASQIQEDKPDQRIMTCGATVLGASVRTFQQINFSRKTLSRVNDFFSRWSLPQFEAIWQLFLNISNNVGREACLDILTGIFGYQLANEFFTIFTQKQGSRAYYLLNEEDLNSEEVNNGTGFTLSSPKKRLMLHAAIAAAGAGLTVFGYLTSYAPQAIITSAGWFLTLFGAGACASQIALSIRKKKLAGEQRPLVLPDIDSGNEMPILTKKEKTIRFFSKLSQLTAPEILVSTLFVTQMAYPPLTPPSFAIAGLAAGGLMTVRQISFGRGLTKDVYKAQQKKNTHKKVVRETVSSRELINEEEAIQNTPATVRVRNTALKVDSWLTFALAAGFLGWFCYGISQSSWQDQTGIALLIGGTFLSAFLTLIAETMFEPGQSNAAVNLLRFFLFENSYLLPVGYLFFNTISGITDVALQLDGMTQFIFGLLGIFCFGMFFGNVSVLNISKNRPTPAYAPTAFRIRATARVVQRLLGTLTPTTLPQ